MNEKADAQLLRDYAERADEDAFRELVLRHTDLLYSSALRQLESPDLACDVVQNTFCDLARKGRQLTRNLDAQASLLGWLYRSARFLALNKLRDDRRRQARERQAMEQLEPTRESAAEWDRVRPLLDEAMANLPSDDRQALLLRFFKNDDYHTVGAALGISDDAAQKRVSRALEKLRAEFSRRGVATTAVALASAVSANAVTIAPAGLAAAATATALASAGASAGTGLTLFKLLAVTKLRTAVGSALITAALITPLVLQRESINYFRLENARLRNQKVATLPHNGGLPDETTADLESVAESPAEQSELMRLRGQVGVLQRELAAVNTLPIAPASPLTPRLQSTNPFPWMADGKGRPSLNSDQAEAYVKKNGRKPESLLAAYYTSGDKGFLREAKERYPNDAQVAFVAMAEATAGTQPGNGEYGRWLARCKEAAPDNSLPNYLAASWCLQAGQIEEGLRELQAATSKSILDSYSVGLVQSCEQAYLSAGYSEWEAKAAATLMEPLKLSSLSGIRDKVVDVARSYQQAGDGVSAQKVLEMGFTLGQRLVQPSPSASVVRYMCGLIIEDRVLRGMNPDSLIDGTGRTARDQIEENAQLRAALEFVNGKDLLLSMPAEDLPGYLDRTKTSGMIPALQWLQSKYGQQRAQ